MTNRDAILIVEVWDVVRDHIPNRLRVETATSILRSFAEHGEWTAEDLRELIYEDTVLAKAFADVFGDELELDEDEPRDED